MSASVTVEDDAVLRSLVNRLLALGTPFEVWPASKTVFCRNLADAELAEAAAGCADGAVTLSFDQPQARGTLAVRPAYFGPMLAIDDDVIGAVDMFHRSPAWTEGDEPEDRGEPMPAQLLLFDPANDAEIMAKVIVEGGRMVVIVSSDCEELANHPRAVHFSGDRIFRMPGSPPGGHPPTEPVIS